MRTSRQAPSKKWAEGGPSANGEAHPAQPRDEQLPGLKLKHELEADALSARSKSEAHVTRALRGAAADAPRGQFNKAWEKEREAQRRQQPRMPLAFPLFCTFLLTFSLSFLTNNRRASIPSTRSLLNTMMNQSLFHHSPLSHAPLDAAASESSSNTNEETNSNSNSARSRSQTSSLRQPLSAFEHKLELMNPMTSKVPPQVMAKLKDPWSTPTVPVVQVFLPFKTDLCEGFLTRTLRQARKVNSVVYLIGDIKHKEMCQAAGIRWEAYSDYADAVEWYDRTYGNLLPEGAPQNAAGWNVKFFLMKLFMERHSIPRMFFTDSDVMLFANVTELVASHFNDVPLALGYRWPSLQHRGPRHVTSVSASTHVSIWTYDALCDFLAFFDAFFKNKVIPRKTADGITISNGPYNDMWLLGWYTFRECWMHRYEDLHPACVSDSEAGFTPERTARIRGKFVPRYPVVSLSQQRWCKETSWSNEGWCVFDNNFAARVSDTDPGGLTPKVCFRYRPDMGDKAPISNIYTYFEDWSEDGRKQDKPIQFLGVHFQGRKKCLLNPWEKDQETWACL